VWVQDRERLWNAAELAETRKNSTVAREFDDLKSGEVNRWRQRWATLVNEHLEERGHAARVDHPSLEAQGIEREPTRHMGPAITATSPLRNARRAGSGSPNVRPLSELSVVPSPLRGSAMPLWHIDRR
jgi:hypothetical protein